MSAFIVLWFFLTRQPCRIVTTSADFAQLESVLWGEIRRFIEQSRFPLEHTKGGPLIVNHLHIRRAIPVRDSKTNRATKMRVDPLSYIIGRVAAKGEGMLGHHAYPENWDGITPHTLLLCDEASGIDDITIERGETWAKRILIVGNPFPCTNFFYRWVKEGDVVAKYLPPSPVSTAKSSRREE